MRDGIRIKKEQQALDDIERAVRALAFNAGLSTEDVEAIAAAHAPDSHRDPGIKRLRRVEALAELAGAFVQRTAGFTITDGGQPVQVDDLKPQVDDEQSFDDMPDHITPELMMEMFSDIFGEKIAALLIAAGFTNFLDVAMADDDELLAIDGIGAASLVKIREQLAVAANDETPED